MLIIIVVNNHSVDDLVKIMFFFNQNKRQNGLLSVRYIVVGNMIN